MSEWPSSFPQPIAKELSRTIDDEGDDTIMMEDAQWPDLNVSSNLPLHVIGVYAVGLHRGEIWPNRLDRDEDDVPCRLAGYEFSGIVISTSPRSPLKPGTEVYGRTNFRRDGNARTYTVATFNEIAAKPKTWSWAQCAAVPIGGLVAFQALFSFPLLFEPTLEGWGHAAGLDGRNSKVHLLITGAASPAGVWAIQLAKLAGVHRIVATCSAEDIPFVRSLGANVALDWAEDGNLRGWSAESGGQFNAVLDLMGGHTLTRAWRLVRDGGKIVSVARDTASARPAGASNSVLHYNFVLANCPRHLKTIAYLADTGHLKPVLDPEDIFEFDDFEAALQKLRNHRRGQVVLQLRPLVLGGIIDLLRTNGRKWENQRDFDEVVVELSRGEDASDEYD